MKLGRYTKTPIERKRYVVDYTDWLDTSETVTGVTFTPSPIDGSGFQIDAYTIDPTGKTVAMFVAGGADGTQYTLDIQATTSGGQIKEDQVLFSVRT